MREVGLTSSPFRNFHTSVIIMAVGVGFCDWRAVNVLTAARRQGMLGEGYAFILVQTQEENYATTVCIGEQQKDTDIYVDSLTNVLLVSCATVRGIFTSAQ